jgi:hypothetical protein
MAVLFTTSRLAARLIPALRSVERESDDARRAPDERSAGALAP